MTEKNDGWSRFKAENRVGDHLRVRISSIVKDIGLLCDLPTGVYGIVHLSDLGWDTSGEELIKAFNVGDEVGVMVLRVEPDRQRVCLGIKQLRPKPRDRRDGPPGPEPDPVWSPGPGPRPPRLGGAAKPVSDTRDD